MRRKEKGIGVETSQDLPLIHLHDRLQLKHIPHEQQLLAAKRHPGIAGKDPQDLVNAINQISTYHRYLINDDQLHLLQDLPLLLGIFKEIVDTAMLRAQVRIIRQHRPKRQFEKGMQGDTSCIDRCDARGCQHHVLLLRMLTDILKESRFSRPGLAREEDRLTRMRNQIQRILKFRIISI